MSKTKYTYDIIQAEANKYTTRNGFKLGNGNIYAAAVRNGIIAEVCAHMEIKMRKWTKEELMLEAGQYTSVGQFLQMSRNAYMAAQRLGFLGEVCTGMVRGTQKPITYEQILKVAATYTTRKKFHLGSPGEYNKARVLGVLDEACVHMRIISSKLSDMELTSIAAKYTTRMEFKEYDSAAYSAIVRKGLLDQACAHMPKKHTDYNTPTNLYFVEIITKDNSLPTVYKIGVTVHTAVSRRFRSEKFNEDTTINILKTWHYKSGYAARKLEKAIIGNFRDYKYYGDSPLMRTSNSEMFSDNILLDIQEFIDIEGADDVI